VPFAAVAKPGATGKTATPKVEYCSPVLVAMLERIPTASANRWFLGEITLAPRKNSIQHGLSLARPLSLN
jgi:hypothetical protein